MTPKRDYTDYLRDMLHYSAAAQRFEGAMSHMPPTLTPQAFVAKWRKAALKESAASKEHFFDLCQLIFHPPGAPEEVLKKRTLTTLYNRRPTWLDLAHKKLDAEVFAAYG